MHVIKTREAEALGEYKRTAIDEAKDAADIRLLQVGPKVVDSKVLLKGRGIKPMGTIGRYLVSDAAWTKLQQQFKTITDF
jgi:hypothetical protein